jgi:GTP-binding protein
LKKQGVDEVAQLLWDWSHEALIEAPQEFPQDAAQTAAGPEPLSPANEPPSAD